MSSSLSLLPGEEINLESSKISLQLTNFRVRHRWSFLADQQLDSITLDAVASTGLRTYSKPGFLLAAAVLLLLAFGAASLPYGAGNGLSGGLILFALLLVGAYFLSRRRVIVIESAGGFSLRVPVLNLTTDESYFLINAIERAKLEFLRGELHQP